MYSQRRSHKTLVKARFLGFKLAFRGLSPIFASKKLPRRLEDASKTPKTAPRRPQDGPKTPQDGPGTPPCGAQKPTKTQLKSQPPPDLDFGAYWGRFWEGFGTDFGGGEVDFSECFGHRFGSFLPIQKDPKHKQKQRKIIDAYRILRG